MEKVKLDPRVITGELDLKTPSFIIYYIARFCKISYKEYKISMDHYCEEIIREINDFDYPEINIPSHNSTDSELRRLIKFISPLSISTEWSNESIIEGYDHLMKFKNYRGEIYDKGDKEKFHIGHKTDINPLAINEIIAYSMAKYHNYQMDRTTTFDEIIAFIERLLSRKITTFKNSLLHIINGSDETTILKLYYQIGNLSSGNEEIFELPDNKENKFAIDIPMLEMTFNDFFDKKRIATRMIPKTNYEAIIIIALKYGINVTHSSFPLKEFDNLKRRNFIPHCPSFSKKYSISKSFFNLKKKWCLQLSNQNVYNIEQMRNFCLEEGFEKVANLSFGECHSYLKSTKNVFNFYFGRHPLCESKISVIEHEPITEIEDENIICFGSEFDNKLDYITFDELNDHFTANKMFISPVDDEIIEDRAINKLKMFCQKITGKNLAIVKKLLTTITDLEKIKKIMDTKSTDLKLLILKSSDQIKININSFFIHALEMGLYMRGWKVRKDVDFPLISEDTICKDADEALCDKEYIKTIYGENFVYTNKQFYIDNTIASYEKAKEILNSLPSEISIMIRSLNTIRFNKKGKVEEIMGMIFKGASVSREETLVECMGNMFSGIEKNVSCIRTNSNWILYSSAWYMYLFGFEVPFKIDKIDDIQ